ncbi:MAG: hypothetical protein V2I46_10800 [Bacteroides sp.]|jgi:hypothetical protein|nr:hypothetical protein [Bacteroides sp.]
MTRAWLMIFSLLISWPSVAQKPVRQELDFVRHLMSRNEFRESLSLLEGLKPEEPMLIDSVNYFKGWILYQQKQLKPSADFLLAVSPESPLFNKSRFFASYNLGHSGFYLQADSVLQELVFETGSVEGALLNFEKGGVALLMRDYEAFDQYAASFSGSYNAFALQEKSLVELSGQLRDFPRRSPALAGALSAVIPGLGKVYSGKKAEGIASFLYVGAMALTTFDFYRRLGPKNVFFILSAATTGVFYVGNVWGSAIAAGRQRNEFNYEMDQRILFDMHIPLRNIFR